MLLSSVIATHVLSFIFFCFLRCVMCISTNVLHFMVVSMFEINSIATRDHAVIFSHPLLSTLLIKKWIEHDQTLPFSVYTCSSFSKEVLRDIYFLYSHKSLVLLYIRFFSSKTSFTFFCSWTEVAKNASTSTPFIN